MSKLSWGMTPILVPSFVRFLNAGREGEGGSSIIPNWRIREVWDHVINFEDVFDTVRGDQIRLSPGGPMK